MSVRICTDLQDSNNVRFVVRISWIHNTNRQDVDKSAGQNADLPKRFLPCLTCGLAYYMSMKRPGVDGNRIQMLKANYEETLARAMLEDRERATMRVVPRLRYV